MSINKLQTELRHFLKTQPDSMSVISKRTGLSERWLYRFKSGNASPTLRNVVALWDYAQSRKQ